MSLAQRSAWQALASAANKLSDTPLRELALDTERARAMTHDIAGCHFDFAKQWVNSDIQAHLQHLAAEIDIAGQAAAMLRGEHINRSEDRAVLHAALRGGAPQIPAQMQDTVAQTLSIMRHLATEIRNGQRTGYTGRAFTDVVHIGIGGSHLGPELVTDALRDHATTPMRLHFVANIDANELHQALRGLNPETTLFIVVSKSFSTLETQVNANSARSWFLERTARPEAIAQHFVGVTTNISAAAEFGLDPDTLLPMWDWVGGRFSLWSAVGLPILLMLGEAGHSEFLEGARMVDEHFASTPVERNIPMLSGLYGIWNYNFLGAGSLAMLSYDERLKLLPDYLQQLEMESNGKSVTVDGEPVDTHTMPVLWGGTGTKGQHAYHQLLHQGTRAFTADFIVVGKDERNMREHHDWLLANALAQSEAMAVGFDAPADEPHRQVPGNHASTTVVLDELAPKQLGALLAVYEHKVFTQGVIWGINSFDQWGVELGKKLAVPIHQHLQAADGNADQTSAPIGATATLIDLLRKG